MKEKTAKALFKAGYDIGIFDGKFEDEEQPNVRRQYSGRGMRGKATVGLVVHNLLCVAQMAAYATQDDMDDEDINEFVYELGKLESDNMGLNFIIY